MSTVMKRRRIDEAHVLPDNSSNGEGDGVDMEPLPPVCDDAAKETTLFSDIPLHCKSTYIDEDSDDEDGSISVCDDSDDDDFDEDGNDEDEEAVSVNDGVVEAGMEGIFNPKSLLRLTTAQPLCLLAQHCPASLPARTPLPSLSVCSHTTAQPLCLLAHHCPASLSARPPQPSLSLCLLSGHSSNY